MSDEVTGKLKLVRELDGIEIIRRGRSKAYECIVSFLDGDAKTLVAELHIYTGAWRVSMGEFSLQHGWGKPPLEHWRLTDDSLARLRATAGELGYALPHLRVSPAVAKREPRVKKEDPRQRRLV